MSTKKINGKVSVTPEPAILTNIKNGITDNDAVNMAQLNTLQAEVDAIEAGSISITQIDLGDGTVALPALSFTSDLDSGVYRIGSNEIGIGVNGAKVLDIKSTGLEITGIASILSTTDATTKDTGSIITEGGIGVEKAVFVGTNLTVAGTTASTSKDTGAVILEGGIGVEKEIFAGLGINTLTTVKTGDGTAAVPAHSFTSDPNTGIISSAADSLGFVTGGTEQWLINSSGAFNPLTDNAHDIGNGTVNPRDIYITRGIKGVSSIFGTRGIADATCTLSTFTTGKDMISIITLTNFIVGDMGAAAAAKAFGNLIFTFPAGVHAYTITQFNVGFTGAGTANTPDVGLGSEIGSGVVATLNLSGTGAGLSENYVTGQTANDIAGTAEVVMLAPTAGLYTGIALNQAADVKLLHLNAASTWAAGNAGNLTATGTITLKWSIM